MAAAVQAPTDIATDFGSRLSTFNTSSERATISHTPTQLAGSKRKMSFGGPNSFTASNGPLSATKYNAQSTPVKQSNANGEPTVIGPYTAVYSGISVYEMAINDMIVMRRRTDSWLNATQILKVAGVDKGKRTKVLEKEILSGEHEKVQGGYGRYQGTWINYKRGRDFCRAYGVEEILKPLLDYDMGQDGEVPGEGVRIETPTKEQAMAAQRKKMMFTGQDRATLQTPNTTFFQGISPVAANAINALSRARIDSPGSRPGTSAKLKKSENNSLHASQQSIHSDSNSFNIDPNLGNGTHFAKPSRSQSFRDSEPPRKRMRPTSSADMFAHTNGDIERSYRERSPTEPNESFAYSTFQQVDLEDGIAGLPPLPEPTSRADIDKQQTLSSLLLDPTRENFNDIPAVGSLSGSDVDIPIDQSGHTALHWAATLARPRLLRALIAKGANIFRVNSGGESALMRAIQATNNLDHSTFGEMLELLGPTIELRDNKGNTILHHLATRSAFQGRGPSCRYYLETLLEFVVKQGNVTNSSQRVFVNDTNRNKNIGLARFMSDIVNAQNRAGDTALNLAARVNSKSIIQQLLEIGANPSIPNHGGLRPLDFGVGENATSDEPYENSQDTLQSSQGVNQTRVTDSSKHLMEALKTLITDTESSFRSELQVKQTLIDQEQSQLRILTTGLTEAKSELQVLEDRVNARSTLKHQISTLRRLNTEKKNYIAATSGSPLDDVSIGDADNGLDVTLSSVRSPSETSSRTSEQDSYLQSIPGSYVLQARARAYQLHNKNLETRQQDLHSKSTILEKKLRKVVALSTGIDENDIDNKADRLAAAIQSEEGEEMDMTRVREFLRRLEEDGD